MIEQGIPALRIYFCLFIPMSLQMAGQGVFVSLGRSKQAVFFSLLRKAIINAPLTVILPSGWGPLAYSPPSHLQLLGGMACILTMYLPSTGNWGGKRPRPCKPSALQYAARFFLTSVV
mgnify:CR=1 FL=1